MTNALEYDEEVHLRDNIAWLTQADPDDWHRVADEFNWSEPLFVLDWIVRQKDCDIATALLVFWRGEPEFWLQERDEPIDEEPDGYSFLNREICAYVAQRVKAGGYRRSEIAFDPDTWDKSKYVQLAEAAANLHDPNIPVCEDLIRIRNGRKVEADWDFAQRYPERFQLSSYCEPKPPSPDLELYERPGLAEDWAGYLKVEQKTHDSLPEWLKETIEPREEWPDGINPGTAIRSLRRQAGLPEEPAARSRRDASAGQDDFGIFESTSFMANSITVGALTGFLAIDIFLAVHGGPKAPANIQTLLVVGALLFWRLFEMRKSWNPMRLFLSGDANNLDRRRMAVILPITLAIGAASIAVYRFMIVPGKGLLAGDTSDLGFRIGTTIAALVLLGTIAFGLARLFKPRGHRS